MAKLRVEIHPLDWLEKLLDFIMLPLMYIASGTVWELPQRTHRWNNIKLQLWETGLLSREKMAHCARDENAVRKGAFRFHVPILGGWRNYVVLEPSAGIDKWYVGWITASVSGISRIPISGQVRVLRGPEDVRFFGFDAHSKEQIQICHVASGQIGDRGPYSRIPLL